MRFWRRRTAGSQKHISIIIVSSDAPQAVSFRFSRLWGGVVIGVLGLLLAGAVWWGVTVTRVTGLGWDVRAANQGKAQLAEANRQILLLSQELTEMKRVASQIRALAGVTTFEATPPPSANDVLPAPAQASLEGIGAGEQPFLLPEGLRASVDEKDLAKRQQTLFRSTPSAWPVHGWVTSEFKRQSDPLRRQHLGLDIAARRGAPVQAPADGVVVESGWDRDLGWLIVVEHGYGFTTRYGHNASVTVERGDRIRRGQIIALVGSSGRSSAPHLHYEVWKHGVPIDPLSYLPGTLGGEGLFGHRFSFVRSLSAAP